MGKLSRQMIIPRGKYCICGINDIGSSSLEKGGNLNSTLQASRFFLLTEITIFYIVSLVKIATGLKKCKPVQPG